jgi:hypothetical protein
MKAPMIASLLASVCSQASAKAGGDQERCEALFGQSSGSANRESIGLYNEITSDKFG